MSDLIDDIAKFCQRVSIAETTFGRVAVNDGKLMRRLRNGGNLRPQTAERIVRFMNEYVAPDPAIKQE